MKSIMYKIGRLIEITDKPFTRVVSSTFQQSAMEPDAHACAFNGATLWAKERGGKVLERTNTWLFDHLLASCSVWFNFSRPLLYKLEARRIQFINEMAFFTSSGLIVPMMDHENEDANAKNSAKFQKKLEGSFVSNSMD
ncbi:hypothetical protein V1477_001052 [Vespula maculifrons]|uniref:Uncharacterized protein n=1 Tax=Vespula maculifrons TaxID=7453 RepID=A0ABD2D1Y4_VESMC